MWKVTSCVFDSISVTGTASFPFFLSPGLLSVPVASDVVCCVTSSSLQNENPLYFSLHLLFLFIYYYYFRINNWLNLLRTLRANLFTHGCLAVCLWLATGVKRWWKHLLPGQFYSKARHQYVFSWLRFFYLELGYAANKRAINQHQYVSIQA